MLGYDVFRLQDLDLEVMDLVKETWHWEGNQDHSRWVFRARKNGSATKSYYKIWNDGYIRQYNILRGIESGFYNTETVPALKGIIIHKGSCRGYVMHECEINWTLDVDLLFYDRIKSLSRKTGFFNPQLSPFHIMKHKGEYTLIDLESVYHINEFGLLADSKTYFDFEDYDEFITRLHAESHGQKFRSPGELSYRKFKKANLPLSLIKQIYSNLIALKVRNRGLHLDKIRI